MVTYLAITQGVLEFLYSDAKFHVKTVDKEYDLFGHGGMLFWFASSIFFFVVSWMFNLVTRLANS